ncbi:MAG: pyridoxal-5'-phosphate-dependent protein subunit beta [Rickettsiales bacterium]|nr:pyridoxal-5'-phosphate-dependent protein subunit beta [Rickettsiales bacterium]
MSIGLERNVVDQHIRDRAAEYFSASGIRLPRLQDLVDPHVTQGRVQLDLASVDPDSADARNLFRVHWYNAADRRSLVEVPEHIILPNELTGVDAKIVVAIGNRFPMIGAHKVLAAYGCLVPRLVTGQFDPTYHRAVWPSTGNYCRGGVAISTILGCRGVAVLPEGMSRERFLWLEEWVREPGDIVRTAGSESNVKEIYDACYELAADPKNIILNQFKEFGNYIAHRAITGPAIEQIFRKVRGDCDLRARAFVSATGSAGTLAAGDHLKAVLGLDICAVEALECPTLLLNGYGEHNIQGVGDRHVPFIHNAFNTDYIIAVSDKASDALNLLFNTSPGRRYLASRTGLGQKALGALADLGLSSIANILAAIKYAKYQKLRSDDVVLTLATDGSELYRTELDKALHDKFGGNFDALTAAEIFGRYLLGATTDNMKELIQPNREAIFNLGYYTWVEQQGISLKDFDARRDQNYWDGMMEFVPVWDSLIDEFNAVTG